MQRKLHPFDRKGSILIHPPPASPLQPQPTSSSNSKISPAVLLVIVILAIAFFVCGLLHLIVRFLMKKPSIYSLSLSRRHSENSGSDALQRQLQQLFRLHDSGLDQDIIDALPVFCYMDIVGTKEPFDCAVCLCEFSDQDQLRLLPVCSHAFHIDCIDTWLLSNSTCPLCRGNLMCADYPSENQFPSWDLSTGQPNDGGSVHSTHDKPAIMEESAGEMRVYSVRLGKFRSLNNEGDGSTVTDCGEIRSNLDARRCYSMGSCQYVINDLDLLVSLSESFLDNGGNIGLAMKLLKTKTQIGNSMVDGDVEAKRISISSKGESLSVSKIWQWSKKGKFPSSSDTNVGSGGTFHLGLPLTNKVQDFRQWSKKGKFPSSSDTNVGSGGTFHLGLPLTNKVQDFRVIEEGV